MNINSEAELQIINIHIGCKLRLERLKRNLSQHELGILSGTDNTTVGRIERAEHFSGWSNIFRIAQTLNVNFSSLFKIKSKDELINIINECYSYEKKLTQEKENYYNNLKELVSRFKSL